MKTLKILFLFASLLSTNLVAQEENNYLDKVQTLDSTIETLYGVISGEKGEARNWELFRFLFDPEARLIPVGKDGEGIFHPRFLSPNDYIDSSEDWLLENGFYEKELYRKVERFGPVVQVFSTYESYRSESDTKPFIRGINSIQLLYDNNRWWIVNIYWTPETSSNLIPKEYLPN
jgi:hypothetical protein